MVMLHYIVVVKGGAGPGIWPGRFFDIFWVQWQRWAKQWRWDPNIGRIIRLTEALFG